MTSADVAVVGAGPAGLMAAWRAAVVGHQVVVLDGADAVGGMAGSFEVDGVRVDYGSHRLHPSIDDRILGALRSLLGDDLQTRPRRGRVRIADRWVAFPLQLADLIRRLPPSFSARAAASAAVTPVLRPRADTTAEVLRSTLGPAVAEEFYEPYLTKLWGLPPQQLSGELARRRVGARSPFDLVRRALRTPGDASRTFLYPRHGYGQISEALADAAVSAGVDIHLGERVERIRLAADSVQLSTEAGVVDAAYVWSTAPVGALVPMIDPAPPAEIFEAASDLEHRALVLVYLSIDRPMYTEFDAHYFPALDNPVSRLSEPKRYRDGDDPRDRTVLCAELPCSVGDPVWRSSDAELQAMVERVAGAGTPATYRRHGCRHASASPCVPRLPARLRDPAAGTRGVAVSAAPVAGLRAPRSVRPGQHAPRPRHGLGGRRRAHCRRRLRRSPVVARSRLVRRPCRRGLSTADG